METLNLVIGRRLLVNDNGLNVWFPNSRCKNSGPWSRCALWGRASSKLFSLLWEQSAWFCVCFTKLTLTQNLDTFSHSFTQIYNWAHNLFSCCVLSAGFVTGKRLPISGFYVSVPYYCPLHSILWKRTFLPNLVTTYIRW